MQKHYQYILLPTDKATKGCILDNGQGYLLGVCTEPNYTSQTIKPYHLYILSDDEIKEGDWVVETQKGKDPSVEKITNGQYCIARDLQKKIIGTTNPELHNKKNPNHNEDSYVSDVPSISLPDVVYIISLHNDKIKPNNNSIMVEYENVNSGWQQLANNGKRGSTIVPDNLVPKLDKEGNITIIRD